MGHTAAHGTAEHSFDHFGGTGMAMGENAGNITLMGVGHVHHVEGKESTDDHFSGGMVRARPLMASVVSTASRAERRAPLRERRTF